jgi:hypothetical protein
MSTARLVAAGRGVAAATCCARLRAQVAWLPAAEAAAVPRARRMASSSFINEDVVPKKIVQHPYITGGMKYMPGFSFPAPRRLDQIVKYALFERESPARCTELWNAFHDTRLDCVASVWTPAEYAGIAERKRRCPRFVYPVLKGDGKFFTLLAEWQDKFCIFTFLDDYRRNPSAAEPYLSVALFDDLLDRKQLVLVRGDFSGHLTKADATHLLNLMRYFYFQEPRWVETFNKDPATFDFNALLRECPKPPTMDPKKVKMDRDAAVIRK